MSLSQSLVFLILLQVTQAAIQLTTPSWTNITVSVPFNITWTSTQPELPITLTLLHGRKDNMQFVRNITRDYVPPDKVNIFTWTPSPINLMGNYSVEIHQGEDMDSSPRFPLIAPVTRGPPTAGPIIIPAIPPLTIPQSSRIATTLGSTNTTSRTASITRTSITASTEMYLMSNSNSTLTSSSTSTMRSGTASLVESTTLQTKGTDEINIFSILSALLYASESKMTNTLLSDSPLHTNAIVTAADGTIYDLVAPGLAIACGCPFGKARNTLVPETASPPLPSQTGTVEAGDADLGRNETLTLSLMGIRPTGLVDAENVQIGSASALTSIIKFRQRLVGMVIAIVVTSGTV